MNTPLPLPVISFLGGEYLENKKSKVQNDSSKTRFILVNEGIGLILVIQTFNPSTLSVLYNKDVYPNSSIV